ncbi:MAG: YebC/PmpR family DNA-binding transcriptional regulator [Candidatus Yanofskybacteria bacterium]|nr:YebC/PmpR family DNA-binding transcriptional regulator [Candidatus Yanofskybacteria bacterium]
MSGHSKWSQIKHKKAIADAKKGKAFSKLSRAITVAARGNPDPTTNIRLKSEIERARAVNMPLENIERAIRRTTDTSSTLDELTLEFIGPGNTGIVAQAITDSSNRTISELRQLAASHGGRMAGQGSVLWMFKKAGLIILKTAASPELQLAAIDAGADDVIEEDSSAVILTPPEKLDVVRRALGEDIIESAELTLLPTTSVPVTSEHDQRSLDTLIASLEEHDDVQTVYSNRDQES